jgi:hypothetical protein
MTETKILYHYLLHYIAADKIDHLSDEDRLTLINTIVSSGPSDGTWNALIELFFAWPASQAKLDAMKFANNLLADWPISQRRVNSAWGRVINNQKLTDVTLLARSMAINRNEGSGDNELAIIASSIYAINLAEINIDRSNLSVEAMFELTHSKFLNALNTLNMNGLTLSDEKLNILLNPETLTELTSLTLRNCGISGKRGQIITGSKLFKQVEDMNLSMNTISDEGVQFIAETGTISKLKHLDLSENYISDEAVILLLNSGNMPNLTELILSKNSIKNPEILITAAKRKNIKIVI